MPLLARVYFSPVTMNTSFELSAPASHPAALTARLQRVLATTLADWRQPLPCVPALDDDESPRPHRRCSLLSRPGRRATTAYGH